MVRYLSDTVLVMYLGKVVERADKRSLFSNPGHPYTQALLSSVEKIAKDSKDSITLTGDIPSQINIPEGCAFNNRCPYAMNICRKKMPEEIHIGQGHFVSCHLMTGDHGEES